MSQLFKAMNGETTVTENGAKAYQSTMSSVLDFFFKAPASRGRDCTQVFHAALAENEDLALRALLWLRDVREGAGERDMFRSILVFLANNYPATAAAVARKIPELGRFDDLLCLWGTELEELAIGIWLNALADNNALAFKWAPRKDKKGAKPLRTAIRLTEEQWRKVVVAGSNTVEQKMCSRNWEEIDFSKVSSVASARYSKAFTRNSKAYANYLESLTKGEEKVNAKAIFPHDVVKACKQGNTTLATEQWKALPDFLEGSKYKNILPVVDVSGSMWREVSKGTSALDVAVSLGIYCSERSTGVFKDKFITFSSSPKLQELNGNLKRKIGSIECADWGMSTDIEAVFDLILRAAVNGKVANSEMPDVVLIPSDMQFNGCVSGTHLMPSIREKFAVAGYEMPKLVFWQMLYRAGGIPITASSEGVAIVSGFSPSVLKSVLSGEIDPIAVMERTLLRERYNIEG